MKKKKFTDLHLVYKKLRLNVNVKEFINSYVLKVVQFQLISITKLHNTGAILKPWQNQIIHFNLEMTNN